jgi:hypothetical protein
MRPQHNDACCRITTPRSGGNRNTVPMSSACVYACPCMYMSPGQWTLLEVQQCVNVLATSAGPGGRAKAPGEGHWCNKGAAVQRGWSQQQNGCRAVVNLVHASALQLRCHGGRGGAGMVHCRNWYGNQQHSSQDVASVWRWVVAQCCSEVTQGHPRSPKV